MGFFSGETCCICGKKAGLLTRQKLGDRQFICFDCQNLCSSELTPEYYSSIGKETVLEAIESHKQGAAAYASQFRPNLVLRQEGIGGHDVLAVDERNGWWANLSTQRPEVYGLNQITGWELRLKTEPASPDEQTHARPMRQDFPACGRGEKVTGMSVFVSIDHPVVPVVEVKVMDALIPVDGDVMDGYRLAERIYDYFSKAYMQAQQQAAAAQAQMQAQQQAAALSAAAQAAAVAAAQAVAPAAASSAANDMAAAAETLKKMKELVDMGILTQAEFDAKKKQLLGL